MGRVFIFDFDGTIADTSFAIKSIANKIAVESGRDPLSEEDVLFFKENGARAFLKKRDVSFIELPGLILRGRRYFSEKKNIVPVDGIKNALITLKKKGNRLLIVSSNEVGNICSFLSINGMDGIFESVICEKGIFNKNSVIKKAIKKVEKGDIYYVGDEVRDAEAALKAGVPFVGVSWGFNSERALIEAGAIKVIRSPEGIARL